MEEELFGAGYGFIPDRLEGALGHAFRRQVACELAVDVPFVQNARVERLALPDELAKHSRPRTCAGDDERVRIAVRAPNFHAAEALVEGAMLKAVELANRLAREYVLGCAGAEDPAVLHANHLVGAFLRELEFVDGHDDSHIPRFRKVAKYSQQVDLVADIEIRRGLVEHEHTRILRDGACEHHALALPVAYLHEVALGELFHMCGFHGLIDPTMVVGRECAHSPGVGMPSRLYDIAAGEELGPGAICQHNGKVPCELRRLPSGNLPPVELDRAGKRCQMARDGFQDGRLARAVRPDERHDVARVNLQIDAFD